ncbi:MAG: hypothetical protein IID40_00725 [Planctomycetes bacterium]|nr:hypothetical protein [Planctomycetota bacterium]
MSHPQAGTRINNYLLEELIGTDGLQHFKRSIADNLPAHNAAATQLFDNWIHLVF